LADIEHAAGKVFTGVWQYARSLKSLDSISIFKIFAGKSSRLCCAARVSLSLANGAHKKD